MMNHNGKKLVLWILSLILCVTACAPAFASAGDRVLLRRNNDDDNFYISGVLPYGDGGFYVLIENYPNTTIKRYTDYLSEPETFVKTRDEGEQKNYWLEGIEDENPAGEEDEDLFADDESEENQEIQENEYVYCYFGWNGEIYALMNKNSFDGENVKEDLCVERVKLEDGKIIMETDNVPELDFSSLKDSDEGRLKFYGAGNVVTAGDNLFMTAYTEEGDALMAFDLNTGFCTEGEMQDISEIAAGPDGTLLVTRAEWDDNDYETMTLKINKMDAETMSETPLTELKIKGNSQINPCYDAKTDNLYYIANGELWEMPHFDAEKAVAVNDCPENGNGMIMLKDGFVLVQMFSSIAIRNTDPAQRGSIKLRVKGGGGYYIITNTIYDMNSTRGDVSVVADQDWGYQSDILQAMMNRDANTDIYLLSYESNEFSALRNRGYLIDLGTSEKISANVNRMYPYIQEALKQDGKIIAVPMYSYGYTLGLNRDALKMLGIKEDELPKTWNQFFDWMDKLPALMENVSVKISWEDRLYMRSSVMETMIEQYELWMEKKGEKDYAFNTPVLCDLIRRLNSLDYEGLKAREHVEYDEDSDDGYYYDDGGDDDSIALLETYTSTAPSGDAGYIPLFLSFTDDDDAVIPTQLQVVFVNPYSEHQQEAIEFLEHLQDNLELTDEYTLYTDKTEPVRYSGQDESLAMIKEAIDQVKAKIEKAEDEEKKTELGEKLKELEESLEEMERYSWRISKEEIERYQANQNLFKVKEYSFYNDLFGSNNKDDDDEDRYAVYDKLFYSEESMTMAPEELLGMLDSKVQMIRLEGN